MENAAGRSALRSFTSGRPIDQIAFLVEDIDEAKRAWGDIANHDSWLTYRYGPDVFPYLQYRGTAACYEIRVAISGISPQLELIQVLSGPSIYREWLDLHGPGFHHVGFIVPSIQAATETIGRAGLHPIMEGRGHGLDGDGGFAYYGGGDEPIIELIERPRHRRPSEEASTIG